MTHRTIERRIWELLDSASDYYDMPFAPPKVLVDLTGADAGQAIYDDNLLRFNMDFCHHNGNHFVHNIVAHEMAHLVAPRVYGRTISAHGNEWREVMTQVFRVSPENYHSYDLRQSRRYRFIYGCRCLQKETPMSATRHYREQRGTVYFCGECRERLQFLYEESGYPSLKKVKSFRRSGRCAVPLPRQRKLPLPG